MDTWKEVVEAEAVIASVVRKVALGATPNEVEQICSNINLWLGEKLSDMYDPERGVPVLRYIATVAHSRAVDYMRGRKAFSQGGSQDSLDADAAEGATALSERVADESAADAFQMVAAAEERAELVAAFRTLPDGWAEFAMDAYIDDVSVADMAVKHGISEKTVYSRKCKIKALLVAELG